MKELAFSEWLKSKFAANTAKSRLSNCLRIEKFEKDLDTFFSDDQGKSLIIKLTYTKDDKAHQRKPKHKIPIKGDVYNGTATLKQAANLYFKFKSGKTPIEKKKNVGHTPINTQLTNWPKWAYPDDEELRGIVELIAKYIMFLDPSIIKAIVEDNNLHLDDWSEQLISREIDHEIYLWKNCPCAFPGVRRYAGSKEIAFFRGHTQLPDGKIPNALRLDDNEFPKQLWAFIFTGKKFSKSGPNKFSLAHLADHKIYKNRFEDDFVVTPDLTQTPLFGLYTCPTNTAYIPTSLIRPTDFSPLIRHILLKKTIDLYENICEVIPAWLKLKDDCDDKWKISDFQWAKPVGDTTNIGLFLKYRNKTMNSLFQNDADQVNN